MPHLTDLPDELLNDIVERMFNTSPDTLPNIGSTCKRLQRLSHPLQWEHVVLPWRLNTKSLIARFIGSHSGNGSIRSIRLQPQRSVLNAFRVNMKNAYDHVDGLCETLGSLSGLTTFSIFLDDQVDSRCQFRGPVLARIVRSFPPSLRHLELDTECIDRISEDETTDDESTSDPDKHLCLAISERVAELETLRLRLSCICTDLFRSLRPSAAPKVTSKLRRVFIRLDTSPGKESHITVPVDVRDCALHRSSNANIRPPQYRFSHDPLTMEKMQEYLLGLQTAGAFPELQRFIIWSWDVAGIGARERHCHVLDIATRSVTHYPKLMSSRLGDLRLSVALIPNFDTWYLLRDHDQRDWFGGRKMLEKALLHEVSWKERADGVRMPPSGKLGTKETRICSDGLLELDEVIAKDRDMMGQPGTSGSRLPDMIGFSRARVSLDRL
jgi:hypothetical protein